jgi:hypothetical protein
VSEHSLPEQEFIPLDHESELALQHEVDLVPTHVAVNPTALSGLKSELVDSETHNSERTAK